ncbi:MAG: ABC transporter substrate-binding protein [Rhizobiales bacterium]|nr:ABC transporter substrate-binding protein [Hyphomicrobiales bacterium]
MHLVRLMTAGVRPRNRAADLARAAASGVRACMMRARAVVAVGVAGVVLAACAVSGPGVNQPSSSTANVAPPSGAEVALGLQQPVKVAMLLPLSATGPAGKVAKGLKQAGELALFEQNNPNVLLFTKDTAGTAEGARQAAQEAIAAGAELIIGPLFAKSVEAAAAVARPANVPVIAFSTDRAVAGNGVYLLSFMPGEDISRVVGFASQQGGRNYAALLPQSEYGQRLAAALDIAVRRNGGTVATVQSYPLDANGMLDPVKRVKDTMTRASNSGRPVDVLLIAGGQDSLPTLATLLPYNDIDTRKLRLIGTSDWDFPAVGQQEALVGAWYPAPDPDGWREFTSRFSATYGSVPPRIASVAHDAVSLAIALSANPAGQRFTAANLTRPSGFAGIDGLFRLTAEGTSDRGLAVLEVQKFGPRLVDPAPTSFGPALYSGVPAAPATY